MKLILKVAGTSEIKEVRVFFGKYLDKNTSGLVSEEYLCPFGVSANIKKGQLIILKNKEEVMGALRFYPRKTDNIVSVYQFALDERIRGKGFIKKMLEKTGYKNFETNCFLNDS